MSPQRHEFVIVLGTLAAGWWSHLSPVKQALTAMAAVALIAFTAGSMVSQLVIERSGALRRLNQLEVAVRDSVPRTDDIEAQGDQIRDLSDRVKAVENILWRVDDRTLRMQCLLQGNRGPACL